MKLPKLSVVNWWKLSLLNLVVAMLYIIFAEMGFLLAHSHANVTAVWPPTGFAFAVIFLFGNRLLAGVFLGALISNILSFYPQQTDFLTSLLPSLFIAIGNALEAFSSVYLIRKLITGNDLFTSLKVSSAFVIVTTFIATVISASVGVGTLYVFSLAPVEVLNKLWWTWWLGDTVGALTVGPFLLALYQFRHQLHSNQYKLELGLLLTISIAIGFISFSNVFTAEGVGFPFVLLSIPLLLWSVIRFQQFGSTLLIIMLAMISIYGTINEFGPFIRENPEDSLLLLQSFIFVLASCSLLLTSVIIQFRNMEFSLMRSNKELEQGVAKGVAEIELTQSSLLKETEGKKAALDGMSKSEFMLNEMGRIAKVGAWEYDLVNEELFWTEEVFRIHGIEKLPSVAEALKFYTEESQVKIKQAVTHLMETGENYDLELQIQNANSQIIWIHTIGLARYKDGVVTSVIGVIQDIDNAKCMELERDRLTVAINQTQKLEAVGTLAGGIAHDFNNILTAIVGYSDLTLADTNLDYAARENIHHILDAGKRATDLVKQILSFSRKGEDPTGVIKLKPIMYEVIGLVRASMPSSVELSINISDSCGSVLAGNTQMHQVILNICTNAAYEMREKGGVLSMTLDEKELQEDAIVAGLEPGNYAVMSISDTGGGIPEAIQKRVFEPFFTTKVTGEGTGLGLSVAHGIISNYGGKIILESILGKGTSFLIYIPICKDEAVNTEEDLTTNSIREQVTNRTVLFVDDEESVLKVAEMILIEQGYKFIACNSGDQALKELKNEKLHIDLLLTDQTMPGMTGDQLCRLAMEIHPDLPTILMSGFSYNVDEKKSAEMGISAYLSKPYGRNELQDIVRKVLKSTS